MQAGDVRTESSRLLHPTPMSLRFVYTTTWRLTSGVSSGRELVSLRGR